MNKKADEFMNWPELTCFFTILLGFMFALSVDSLFLKYSVLFLIGLTCGRMVWLYVKFHQYYIFMIAACFIIGFVLGARSNLFMVLLVFLGGAWLSYYAHKEKWLP